MEAFKIVFSVMTILMFIYLGTAVMYVFVYAIAGLIRKEVVYYSEEVRRIAIMIPAYKEDEVIMEVALKATQQNYPPDHFDVIVIADSLKEETLRSLETLPIDLIRVSFEKSTKSKALNYALSNLHKDYDIALILDADNIMESDFLKKINQAFHKGFNVVQGKRIAKNLNTSFAILDGISEAVNNHIFRQGHRAIGLSSGLIGSGMAFDFVLFKAIMKETYAVGGFDKELEFRLFQDGHKIEYLNNALVYDEKIQNSRDFNNQRRRWLSTNRVYLNKFIGTGIKALFQNGNIDIIDKLYQMVLPPRVLLVGAVFIMSFVHALIELIWKDLQWSIQPIYWHLLFVLTILTFLASIPRSFYNKKTLKACLSIPHAFFIMFILLFKLKDANKEFIHTRHHSVTNN
jgi:cellulose synthase/poly-beta-1,6-N-acetylglucosamine synthase-like glycosyltransferase